jgi:ribosomal protein S18 acetylase RimI-like enzyme
MEKIQIAATVADDVNALMTVAAGTELFPPEMLPEMLAPVFAGDGSAVCLSAHVAGVAIGFAYSASEDMTDGTWNMLALAVHPDHQGSGAGGALVTATETALAGQGARMLIVDTSGTDGFARTREFYAKAGYRRVACISEYWAAGDDKITFAKPLK